jgi:exoribonuclease R
MSGSLKGILQTKDYINFNLIQSDDSIIKIQTGIEAIAGCLPGDLIQFQEESGCFQVINRAIHKNLVGILELTSKTRYGLTSRGHSKYLWRPMNPAYPPFIVGSSQKDLTKNVLCSINLKDSIWNSQNTKFPEGEIVEYFGSVGDWKAERRALLKHWCPQHHSSKGLLPVEIRPENNVERYTIGSIYEETVNTFHIDPLGCRDVDDILTIYWNSERKIVQCIITIADVAGQFDSLESQILQTAQDIGSTFYDENGSILISMLPKKLSEEYLSLHDNNRDKYGISLDISISLNEYGKTNIEKQTVFLSKIKPGIVKTFTYDSFLSKYPNHNECTIVYRTLEDALGRNGLNYNGIETGEDGIHCFVETTMLYYNWFIGNFLAKSKIVNNIPYRSQERSDAIRIKTWQENAAEMVQSAKYTLGPDSEHCTLGLKNYCHASSPIRRFCDLWIQFELHSVLENTNSYIHNQVLMVNKLNNRSKAQRKFGKQIKLLAALENNQRKFSGICLEWKDEEASGGYYWKGKFLVKELGMIYTVRQTADKIRCELGQSVCLKVGLNFAESVWKRRFVFGISME